MDGQSQPRTTTTNAELHPQARHHTYLPGIVTPLLSDSPIHTRGISNALDGRDSNVSSRNAYSLPQQQQQLRQSPHCEHRPSWVKELAILELSPESSIDDSDDTNHTASQHSGNNIVIFPGSIVPLRLLDHEWITYLQQQIHSITSTTFTNTTSSSFAAPVRFGILMPRPRNISGDDDNNNDERNRSSLPEQRQSWTRQAHGPASLRRLSDQLIQELGPNFDYDEDDDSSDNDHTDLRNLNSTMITEPEVTVLPTTTSAATRAASAREEHLPPSNDNDRLVSHRNDQVFWTLGRRRPRQSGQENDARRARRSTFVAVPLASTSGTTATRRTVERFHSDEDVTRSQQSQQPYSQPPSELRNWQRDFHVMLQERQRQRNLRATQHRELRLSTNSHTNNNNSMDRFIGRIGTIATVLYTHGNNESHSNSADNRRSISTSSLVITAIGTSRFRIIGYRNDDEENEYNNINNGSRHFSGPRRRRHGNLKHFLIEELKDEPLNLPGHCQYRHLPKCGGTIDTMETNDETIATTTFGSLNYYEHYLLHLSIVSPYPHYILRKMWPWKIIADICHYIEIVAPKFLSEILLSSRNGNEINIEKGSVPDGSPEKDSLDMFIRSMDPTAFSYWMATNLPFQYEDKIHLLEICSTIERLHFIYDKLQNEQLYAAMIHCMQCKSPLAFTYDMFTVDGADGTTGNYVNEYGHVHQTITLRSIDEDGVWYQGQPQTQDSWFPGYCWTIMACAVCGHHLGWKFTTNVAASGNINHPKRLTSFYGVSAANIITL